MTFERAAAPPIWSSAGEIVVRGRPLSPAEARAFLAFLEAEAARRLRLPDPPAAAYCTAAVAHLRAALAAAERWRRCG